MSDTVTAPVAAGNGTLDGIIDAAIGGEDAQGDETPASTPVEADLPGRQVSGGDESGGGSPAAPEALAAPQDWRADQRERFAKLPPEARSLVLEQYKDFQSGFTRKSQELSDQARLATSVRVAFEPYQQQLASTGLDEAGAVRSFLALHHLYQSDPLAYLRYVAARSGIDLDTPGNLNAGYHSRHRPNVPEGALDGTHARPAQQAWAEAGPLKQPQLDRPSEAFASPIQADPGITPDEAYRRAEDSDGPLSDEARRQRAVAKAKRVGRTVRSSAPANGASDPQDLDSILAAAIEKYQAA